MCSLYFPLSFTLSLYLSDSAQWYIVLIFIPRKNFITGNARHSVSHKNPRSITRYFFSLPNFRVKHVSIIFNIYAYTFFFPHLLSYEGFFNEFRLLFQGLAVASCLGNIIDAVNFVPSDFSTMVTDTNRSSSASSTCETLYLWWRIYSLRCFPRKQFTCTHIRYRIIYWQNLFDWSWEVE